MPGNYSEVVKYVSKSTEVLAKNVAHLDTVLATLQPQSHSLGAVAVLCVRLQNTSHTDANIDTLHATVAEFINVCSEEQIKYAPDMSELWARPSTCCCCWLHLSYCCYCFIFPVF